MEFSVVLVTAKDQEEAGAIASSLVRESLAGCVNIVPSIRSIYVWEGNICDEGEALMIIKTRREKVEQVAARVKQLHSYTVPEVVALSVTGGSADYLKWLEKLTE